MIIFALLKLFLVWIYFFVCTIICLVLSLFRPVNAANASMFSHFLAMGCHLLGFKIEVRNWASIYSDYPCIYLGNHQDNLDIFVYSYVRYPAFVSIGKKELKLIPLFGQLFWLAGQIFIDRSNTRKAIQSLEKAKQYILEKNLAVFIFPEGTRSRGKGIGTFKKGAFRLAIETKRPIKPVIVSDYLKHCDHKKWPAGKIIIEALPIIPTDNYTLDQVDELKDHCYHIIKNHFEKLNKEIEASN